MKKTRKYYTRIGVALFLLCNPNIHIIDFLPDFIAYFLIYSVISEAADLAPHFAQARDACKRLAILGLFKIPASFLILLARSHNTMDSNLIPTFAIVFAIFEMILGYTFIYHTSEALFYLGERSDAAALISPFRLCKPRKEADAARSLFHKDQNPDTLRSLSFIFLFFKSFAAFLPELLLLTRKQEYVGDYAGQTALMRLYPSALTFAFILTLAFGIYWLIYARAYMRTVKKEGKFQTALHTLAGEELIQRKERHELCSAYTLAFSLLASATFFSLNFMPLFCYPLFLLLAVSWMRLPKAHRRVTRLLGIVSILTSLWQSLSLEMFEYDYDYFNLLSGTEAREAYNSCVLAAAINSVMITALVISVFLALRHTILTRLGVSPESERYGRTEKKYHGELIRFNLIFLLFGVLSTLCRGFYVYLQGQVTLVPTFAAGVTLSHQWEFWPLILVVIAIPYIIYSFYYMGVMKEEIKLSLDIES